MVKKSEDKEHNIFAVRFNENNTDYCEEFTTDVGQDFVIDIDKNGKICGIEIFDYKK